MTRCKGRRLHKPWNFTGNLAFSISYRHGAIHVKYALGLSQKISAGWGKELNGEARTRSYPWARQAQRAQHTKVLMANAWPMSSISQRYVVGIHCARRAPCASRSGMTSMVKETIIMRQATSWASHTSLPAGWTGPRASSCNMTSAMPIMVTGDTDGGVYRAYPRHWNEEQDVPGQQRSGPVNKNFQPDVVKNVPDAEQEQKEGEFPHAVRPAALPTVASITMVQASRPSSSHSVDVSMMTSGKSKPPRSW